MYLSEKFKHLERDRYVKYGELDVKRYLESLVRHAKNPELWPSPDHSDNVKALLKTANVNSRSEHPSDNLSAIFIYHQLLAQVLIFLADNAAFLQQIQFFPRPIFPIHIKKDMQMSRIIGALEQTVWFQNKYFAVSRAKEVNSIRNKLAHDLVSDFDARKIKSDAKKVAGIMSLFMFISLEGYGDIRDELSHFLFDDTWPNPDLRITNDHGTIIGTLGEIIDLSGGG